MVYVFSLPSLGLHSILKVWEGTLSAGQKCPGTVLELALNAFTDQKRRFFPNLDDDAGAESSKKKHCVPLLSEELSEQRTLPDILMLLEKDVPSVKTSTYQRLEWLKRASVLPASESSVESLKDHSFHNKLGQSTVNNVTGDKVSVIELLFPSIFRVVISLHPAGSTDPDALAFFSLDEGGSYVHSRGFSIHHVFKHMTEHASLALQYFAGSNTETALYMLLYWVCSYRTILTKVCSKCGCLLSMDKQSGFFLPPVCRPYRKFSTVKVSSWLSTSEDQSVDVMEAFHSGCYLEEA